MLVLDEDNALKEVCKRIVNGSIIAIDTEFIRTRTYYAELSLIQFNFITPESLGQQAVHKDTYIIDVLSGVNIKPFLKVFNNKHNIKVFHATLQDLEVFYHLQKSLPENIYDTQIMASFANYPAMISYAELVKDICNVELDKEEQCSDWLKRPLTTKQLSYSSRDVEYLADVFLILRQKLINMNRETWERHYTLETIKSYARQFADLDRRSWSKFNFHSKSPSYIKIVMGLASWREHQAVSLNVNRAKIITDKDIKDIAIEIPRNLRELQSITGMKRLSQERLQEILGVVNTSLKISDSKIIQKMKAEDLGRVEELNYTLFNLILQIKSIEYNVPARNLASHESLKNIANNPRNLKKQLTRWQYDLYGKLIEGLLSGEVTIGYKDQELTVISNNLDIKEL